jgi:antitoxin component YwqK of YwqJK toxin-antitoxin module
MHPILLTLLLLMVSGSINSQEVNQYDKTGKRQGLWRGYHEPSKRLRYEGTFESGQERGVFKYFDDSKAAPVIATRDFGAGGNKVYTKFFDQSKFVVSEGQLVDKQPEGKWVYYHKSSKDTMSIENYKSGKLSGERKVFYKNGALAESAIYAGGIKHGPYKIFAESGVVLEEGSYENGELHGVWISRDALNQITSKGEYKNGNKLGVWEIYRDGKLLRKEKHPVVKKFAKRALKKNP